MPNPHARNDAMEIAEAEIADVQIVGEHACPTCGRQVVRTYRPGRARIYCTNACRQRAYRWRRLHGVRLCVERNGPAERSHNDRQHALRDRRDPLITLRDERNREVTTCGVFARPVRTTRATHFDFVPESDSACRTCASLIGAGPHGSGVPAHVRKYFDATQSRWSSYGSIA